MHRRRQLATFLTLGLLATVLQASPAAADTVTTINFDSLAAGTMVSTQTSAQGVTFVESNAALGATGLPVVVVAKQAPSSPNLIESTCFGCEFDPRTIRANLSRTARVVSAHVGSSGGCASPTITLRAYDAASTVVGSATATVSGTTLTPVTVTDPSGADIAFIRFFDNSQGCSIRVDNLVLTHPDVGPPADFSVSLADAVLNVAAGVPASTTVSLTRINGSTGNVSLSTSGTGGQFSVGYSPNPITGTSTSSTATVTVPPSSPFNPAGVTTTVVGTPASTAVAPAARSAQVLVRILPTLTATAPATMTVPVCSSVTATTFLARVAGYAGSATLAANSLPAGVTSSFSPATSSGPGTTAHEMTLSAGSATPAGVDAMGVTATAPGASVMDASTTVTYVAAAITGVATPRGGWVAPGETVRVTGTGFCPGTEFRFGNDLATVTPEPAAYNAARTTVDVVVPRLATTGPVRAIAGDSVQTSAPLEVRDHRIRAGFAFDNYAPIRVTHAGMRDVYGADETNFKIDLCWPLGCNIITDLPDPFALLLFEFFNDVLDGGTCFGLAVAGTRMFRGADPLTPYAPAGATTPWALTGRSGPSSPLKQKIEAWHTTQFSAEFLNRWISEGLVNGAMERSAFKEKFRSALASGPVMVSLAQGASGHAVIGHRFVDLGGNNFDVEIYDPNHPFIAAETEIDGIQHQSKTNISTLRFRDGAWTLPGFDPVWTGGQAEIKLVSYASWPRNPTLPTSPTALFSILLPMGDAPPGTVTDSEGRTLSAVGTPTLPDSAYIPAMTGPDDNQVAFAVPRSAGPLTYQVTHDADRTYGQAFAGNSMAARVEGIEGAAGMTDSLGADLASGEVWIDPASEAGALEMSLVRRDTDAGSGQRTAELALSGLGADELRVTLGRGRNGLEIVNEGGRTTVGGSIGWAGPDGVPATISLPEVDLGPGQSLQVTPSAWNELRGTKTQLRVIDADGDVVSKRTLSPDPVKYLRKTKLSVRTVKKSLRKVKVVAVAGRLAPGSVLVQRVQVRKGSRLVKTLERDLSWRGGKSVWRVPVKLRGGRYRFVATNAVLVSRRGSLTSDSMSRTREIRLR